MEDQRKLKIAIVRALYLGDMLCVIPTVRAVRAAYPVATITLVGLPWQRRFVERFQHYFDAFVEFPGWPGLPEQVPNPKLLLEFVKYMQDQQFDLVMQMQGNGEITNAMCMLFAAKKVCGLRKTNEYCPDALLFPVSEDHEHEVLRFLKLLCALDIPLQGEHLEFPFWGHELKQVEEMLSAARLVIGKYVCIHPGARDPRRRWPAENFASVADALAADGFQIVLTGSTAEKPILDGIEGMMKFKVFNPLNEDPNLPLEHLAGLINFSASLLSNDTGVSHIAAALKVPSVIIFSSHSKPERWAPLDTLRHKTISFDESQPEKVLNAMLALLSETKADKQKINGR